jgi:hypothetical protein
LDYQTKAIGLSFFSAIELWNWRILDWRIRETIGLTDIGSRPQSIGLPDIGSRPQSIGLSDIGLTKNYQLPATANLHTDFSYYLAQLLPLKPIDEESMVGELINITDNPSDSSAQGVCLPNIAYYYMSLPRLDAVINKPLGCSKRE